jgi:hypothetical protein
MRTAQVAMWWGGVPAGAEPHIACGLPGEVANAPELGRNLPTAWCSPA